MSYPLITSLVTAAAVALTTIELPGGVEPNTDCGSSSEFTADDVTSTGDSGSSLERAKDEAKENMTLALGVDSGVVCAICDSGIQCTRVIKDVDSSQITVKEVPSTGGQFTAEASYSGKYTVKCRRCKSVEVDGPHVDP